MKRALLTLVVLGALGGAAYAYYNYQKRAPQPTVMVAAVTRGDIAETVGATGTLQAVTTVQVGTQVSGIVQELYADFNTLVKKGQIIARLDPSVIQTQIEQARANLIRAEADLERLKVALDDAKNKLKRAEELSLKNLIPATELETAQVNVRSADAQIRSAEASITQSRASLRQNEVNLEHTIITAPIDGLVISRNVDRGQTVAASMQAPTLFVLAADLTKMQVIANLDESDVGRIRPGQHVGFHVDAYPAEDFDGILTQVRLQPIIQQNVVTYATVIDVPNPQLKLKPGMTANVTIEIARRSNAIRVPNSALRFRPTNEMFASLGQAPPEPGQRAGIGYRGGRSVEGDAAAGNGLASTNHETASARGSSTTAQPPVRGNPEVSGRADGGRPQPQDMTPEQRRQLMERMPTRGMDRSARGAGTSGGFGKTERNGRAKTRVGDGEPQTEAAPLSTRKPNATTIDALFGPLPVQETTGRVWVQTDKQLRPIRVRLGISDGQVTELLEGDLEPGTEVVTNITIGSQTRPTIQGGFPGFMGQPGRGGFGPGGFGGGNRGAGGGGRGGGR